MKTYTECAEAGVSTITVGRAGGCCSCSRRSSGGTILGNRRGHGGSRKKKRNVTERVGVQIGKKKIALLGVGADNRSHRAVGRTEHGNDATSESSCLRRSPWEA